MGYVSLPFRQDGNLVGCLSDYKCIYCNNGGLISNMYDWRPAFDHDKIVRILHRRVLCKSCNHTMAEIHPDFMSQLPTAVAERLPFLTTGSGFGMKVTMIYQFMHLATKGIFYGTYVDIFNKLYRMGHSVEHLSYLDMLSYQVKNEDDLNCFIQCPVPLPHFLVLENTVELF